MVMGRERESRKPVEPALIWSGGSKISLSTFMKCRQPRRNKIRIEIRLLPRDCHFPDVGEVNESVKNESPSQLPL